MRNRKNKGFTLLELLLVIAIIVVLAAISIPIYKAKTDKAKESTCLANRRALYGQVVSEQIIFANSEPF